MRLFVPLPVLPLLLTVACAGDRVKVEGLDAFDVQSEAWAREDAADGAIQTVVLTNVAGWCDKAQAADAAFAELAAADFDEATFCSDAKDLTQAWAAAMGALWYDGAHYLRLAPFGDGGPEDFAEGDWGGDSTAHALSGSLTYVDQDYYASYLEDWDEGGEEIDRCGVKSGNELGPMPTRALEAGTMTVASVAAEDAVAGEAEATFEALDGEDDAVPVTASFDAAWCDLSAGG